MKTYRRLLFALALAAPALLRAAESDIPQAFPPNRYDKLIEKSPFAPATPVTSGSDEVAPFAQNLYITGIGKIGNQDCVYIASRADEKMRYTLFSGEDGPQGIKIDRINYSNDIGRTKVTIRKGTDSATLQFDQAVLQRTVAPTAGVLGVPSPQGQNPGGIPGRGGGRGFGPQQPSQAPQTQPGQITTDSQPAGGTPMESRRRIRIINSRQ